MKYWYDYVFGGKKVMQVFLASILGSLAYARLPSGEQGSHFVEFLGFLAVCFGVYGFYNVAEKKINGNGDTQK